MMLRAARVTLTHVLRYSLLRCAQQAYFPLRKRNINAVFLKFRPDFKVETRAQPQHPTFGILHPYDQLQMDTAIGELLEDYGRLRFGQYLLPFFCGFSMMPMAVSTGLE